MMTIGIPKADAAEPPWPIGSVVVLTTPDSSGQTNSWLATFHGVVWGDFARVAVAVGLGSPVACNIPLSQVRPPVDGGEVVRLADALAMWVERNAMKRVSGYCQEATARLVTGGCSQ